MKSKIITEDAEIRAVEAEDITEEFQDDESLPVFNPYSAYDSLEKLLLDSMVGFCQMMSRGVPDTYNLETDETKWKIQSNKAGGRAARACIKHLKNQMDGTPYIVEPENLMPSLADYYEHNMMVFLVQTVEPRIPDRLKKSENNLLETTVDVFKQLGKMMDKELSI